MDKQSDLPCPECKGTGKVLLLVSQIVCPDCGGSGILEEDEIITEEFFIQDDQLKTEMSPYPGSFLCDPEDDESYFDDGLDLDED